jgi:hypothetical protein
VWDAGLDAGIIECVKLACLRERPELAVHDHRIRVRAIEPGGDLVLASVPRINRRADRARWTTSAAVVAATITECAEWHSSLRDSLPPAHVDRPVSLGSGARISDDRR